MAIIGQGRFFLIVALISVTVAWQGFALWSRSTHLRSGPTSDHHDEGAPAHSLLHCKRSDDYRDRICHLEHVCWDAVDRTWVFFENSEGGSPQPLLSSETGVVSLHTLGTPLVQLRREEEPFEVPLPLRLEPGRHPAAKTRMARSRNWTYIQDPARVHIIFESFWAENFGHAVGDDIFPAFVLLRTFGLLSRNEEPTDDVQLLTLTRPYWRLGLLSRDQAERGNRFLQTFAHLLFRNPIVDMQLEFPWVVRNATAYSHAVEDSGGFLPAGATPPNPSLPRFVCVRHLLAGHSRTGMHYDNGAVWPHFISATLKRAAALWKSVSAARVEIISEKPPLILVLQKEGRRNIINHDEIVAHLSATFSRAKVVSINPATISLEEQIVLAQRVSVLVSPCGGISFFAMFLRRGASAIFMGYWDDSLNRSVNMESWLWRQVPDLHELYYDVFRSEIVILPPGEATRGSWEDFRNYGSVMVNAARLESLVASALHVSIHSMGFTSNIFP